VRVGPARDRDAALQLQQRLAAEGQKGALIAP
jgi:cell division septation protein DedD